MTTSSPAASPIRRSALEAVHAALGATWLRDDARWPVSYGEAAAEAAAVTSGAGLAEIGPIDKVVVRGQRTAAGMADAGMPLVVGAVSAGPQEVSVWCLGEDEVLLLGASQGLHPLIARLEVVGAHATDVSSAFAVLRLLGPAAPALLERACAVDLAPRALANERIAQVAVLGVRMIVARQDRGDVLGYTLLVQRDHAEYAWGALLDLGRDLGVAPVGGAAVGSEGRA